jgi:hypothetical protein
MRPAWFPLPAQPCAGASCARTLHGDASGRVDVAVAAARSRRAGVWSGDTAFTRTRSRGELTGSPGEGRAAARARAREGVGACVLRSLAHAKR